MEKNIAYVLSVVLCILACMILLHELNSLNEMLGIVKLS